MNSHQALFQLEKKQHTHTHTHTHTQSGWGHSERHTIFFVTSINSPESATKLL